MRSRRAGDRVRGSVSRFITAKLKLKVNREKSAGARPGERKFLGFSFSRHRQPKRYMAPKAIERFKQRVRELSRRTRGISISGMAKELGQYLRGWLAYFGHCQTPAGLAELEEWIRRRRRRVIGKQWQRFRVRYRQRRKRGGDRRLAFQTAKSNHGPGRLAKSPALAMALPNGYFVSLGVASLMVAE